MFGSLQCQGRGLQPLAQNSTHTHTHSEGSHSFAYARRDLNPDSVGYKPTALTIKLRAKLPVGLEPTLCQFTKLVPLPLGHRSDRDYSKSSVEWVFLNKPSVSWNSALYNVARQLSRSRASIFLAIWSASSSLPL